MHADHGLRPFGGAGDFINAPCGSIASQNRGWFTNAIEIFEDFLFQRHALERRLDHQVNVCEPLVGERWLNELETFLRDLRSEAATLYRVCVVGLNRG